LQLIRNDELHTCPRAVAVPGKICTALAVHAHGKGRFIHRDIKPAIVMVNT
jgi:serine/threonine protein kinase